MRQAAWLHAAPKKRDGKPGDKSRLATIRERGDEPLFPHNPAPYLIGWLFDIGPTVSASMGESAIGYRDLAAWQECSGVELLPWEAKVLRRLSREYAGMRHEAEDQGCAAPYTGVRDEIAARRDHVAAQVKSVFANLKGKRG